LTLKEEIEADALSKIVKRNESIWEKHVERYKKDRPKLLKILIQFYNEDNNPCVTTLIKVPEKEWSDSLGDFKENTYGKFLSRQLTLEGINYGTYHIRNLFIPGGWMEFRPK
jgi:hypothetical protein